MGRKTTSCSAFGLYASGIVRALQRAGVSLLQIGCVVLLGYFCLRCFSFVLLLVRRGQPSYFVASSALNPVVIND